MKKNQHNGNSEGPLSQAERSARLRRRRGKEGVPDERAVYRAISLSVASAARRAATVPSEPAWLKTTVRSAVRSLSESGFNPKEARRRTRAVLLSLAVGRAGKRG